MAPDRNRRIEDDCKIPRTLRAWVRSLRAEHKLAMCAAVVLLLVFDEFTGVTLPFERLGYMLGRGALPTVVYSAAAVFLSTLAILLLRTSSALVSVSAMALFATATALETSFNLFTGRGFSEDFVAISLREIGLAPEALKVYVDGRVFWAVLISATVWTVAWIAVRRKALFGPLMPTRGAAVALAALMLFGGAWRQRIDHFRAFPAFLRPSYNVADYYIQQRFIADRARPPVHRVDRPELARRIVLIVDESIRPDYLSFQGFERRTTPYLESISDRLYDFGTAVSGSTCSDTSNRLLNSYVRRRDMGDARAIQARPTIFYFAKRAGYRTALLSGVFRSPLFYGIRGDDMTDVDETIMINLLHDGPKYLNDHLLVRELARLFDRYPDEPLFVYMRKQGTHFPFDDYYPPSEHHFEPTLGSEKNMREYPQELINSYLNGIRWNVDSFYRGLDEAMGDQEAVYLYTSDHGENVELEGTGLLHCGANRTMAMVPLWLDLRGGETQSRILEEFGTDFAVRNRDHASHMNVFPTLLTLMNLFTDDLTLFDDLTSQRREYHPPGDWGTYRTLSFDSIP